MYLLTHCEVAEHGLQTISHLNGKAGLYLSYTPPVDHAGVRQIRLMYKLMYKTCLLTQWWIKLSYWYCIYWDELGAGIRQWWPLRFIIKHQIFCINNWYICIFVIFKVFHAYIHINSYFSFKNTSCNYLIIFYALNNR